MIKKCEKEKNWIKARVWMGEEKNCQQLKFKKKIKELKLNETEREWEREKRE